MTKYDTNNPFAELTPHDVARVFADQPDFAWLDSASAGQTSIITWQATATKSFLSLSDGRNFYQFLKAEPQDLWLGFACYEAYAFNQEDFNFTPSHLPKRPLAEFKNYNSYFVYDHKTKIMSLVAPESQKDQIADFVLKKLKNNPAQRSFLASSISAKTSKDRYLSDIKKIKTALSDGDYFELNYTQEFVGKFSGDAFALYEQLRKIAPAPMMAFLKTSRGAILSASPELFWQQQGDIIKTEPIKGTIKRGKTPNEDEQNKNELLVCEKNQAELLMVTDLLRNDLGKICEPGTVCVDELRVIKTYSHYFHTVAQISGRLCNNAKSLDVIFKALFPGGSITGAPKTAVMRATDQLENRARGVYTGMIGCFGKDFSEFNIPIRTIEIIGDELHFATGGGIVMDSVAELEYEECQTKAAGLLVALGVL